MKSKILFIGSMLLSLPLLAAEGDTVILDNTLVTKLNTDLTSLGTDLGSWASKFMPVILGIIGVFMLFWLLKFAIRLVKSFSSVSK